MKKLTDIERIEKDVEKRHAGYEKVYAKADRELEAGKKRIVEAQKARTNPQRRRVKGAR